MKNETASMVITKELIIELLLLSSVPVGFYIVLVIFSELSWSWLWFFIAVILSAIFSLIRERKLAESMTETYFLGIKYLKDRYDLPSLFGNNWDEREDVESEGDRAIFDHFSSKMTEELFKRLFPEEYQEQQEEISAMKK